MPNHLTNLSTFFQDESIVGKIIFGVSVGKGKVNLLSMDLDDAVKESFRTTFLKRSEQFIRYKTVVPYNPNGFGVDEVHTLRIDSIPKSNELIRDASGKVWNFDKNFIKKIKFVVFRFKNDQQEVVSVFKFYPKTKFLAKYNAYIFTSGALKFSKSNIIGLVPSIDCVAIGEEMLVINRNQFEKIFDYNKIYLESAKSLFDEFSNDQRFEVLGISTLKEKTTKSLNRLRRLHNIYTSRNYDQYDAALIREIDSDNNLGIIFSTNNGKDCITFPSPNIFMEVYEDAYLSSKYTSKKYLALSKRNL